MTITAKVIAHSVAEHCPQLFTLQLRYPKFIHGEFLTHRVFSRNSSSSRAIPVNRLIQDVLDDPVIPMHWGKNQPGMQALEECNTPITLPLRFFDPVSNKTAWLGARDYAVEIARAFTDAGYHKQIVNRLLEPFAHINTVVTATEWDNFFLLRDHSGSQPEIRALAQAMKKVMSGSTPNKLGPGEWHLPYVPEYPHHVGEIDGVKLSVARCARVSYLTQDGREPNYEEDLRLYDRLVASIPRHLSPTEHQASPDRKKMGALGWVFDEWRWPHLHGNLKGWVQYRKTIE